MKKVKILMVVNYLNMGGTENFALNVIKNLDKSQFEVEVLCCDRTKGFLEKKVSDLGVKISKVTSRGQNLFKHLKELNKFFKENTFDVVHINYSNAFCITVARAAKKAGIKKIIVHSHNSQSYNKFLHNILKRFLPLYANVYFACSELAANWMFTKKINSSNKVVIIKNAIYTVKYKFDADSRRKIRREFNVDGSKMIIGHIGRFNVQKNHKFLIDIFNEYLKVNNDSFLLLVGEGELEIDIKNYCRELGISQQVIFAGIRNDIPEVLSAMDCFVMPSLFEGLPLTLVEAQANGLKCLVSDCITQEINITDEIEYYSLNSMPKDWAKKIICSKNCREKYNEIVKNSGFDINQELEKIEKIYCE